jgi:hypothetical protein
MMTRRSRLVMHTGTAAAIAAGALAAGCGADVPTTPTAAFGEGVTLYPDSLYRGERITLGGDVADLSKVRGPCGGDSDSGQYSNYDNCVSSIRIPAGWTVVVYRDRGFAGDTATYTADVQDLDVVPGPCRPGFNDCISSLQLSRQ